MSQEVLTELVKALERGDEVALVTIVAAQGSTPQRVGAKMIVYPDGRIVWHDRRRLLRERRALEGEGSAASRASRGSSSTISPMISREESGLICGGQMTVYIEPVEPAPQLYIVGAGHVGHQLAQVARPVGFRIHVLDDREKFANAERFPEADEIIVDSIPDWLHKAEIPPSAYVVVVTRGHRHDLDALRSLAARDLRYIGLIGSKAKVKKIYDALVEEGMPIECLSRIHAPIGLDIGAVSPEEIAISILAELIAVRRGRIDEPHVAARVAAVEEAPRVARQGMIPADRAGRGEVVPHGTYEGAAADRFIRRNVSHAHHPRASRGRRRGDCRRHRRRCGGRSRVVAARGRVDPAVDNPDYEEGQLSSLLVGLAAVERQDNVEAVMVTLVDLPLISPSTVRAVLDAYRAKPDAPLVRPRRGNRYGHPVIFNRFDFRGIAARGSVDGRQARRPCPCRRRSACRCRR